MGNLARFISHSCDPNCVMQLWWSQGELMIGVFAKRLIKPGEECTIDYGYDLSLLFRKTKKKRKKFKISPSICYCDNNEICTGYMERDRSKFKVVVGARFKDYNSIATTTTLFRDDDSLGVLVPRMYDLVSANPVVASSRNKVVVVGDRTEYASSLCSFLPSITTTMLRDVKNSMIKKHQLWNVDLIGISKQLIPAIVSYDLYL